METAAGDPRRRILVVDDDAGVLTMVRRYLGREGFVTEGVTSVAQMRLFVEAGDVDFVILDVRLPDEDGWSALRWLRARSDLPVLMLTGNGDVTDRIVGLELGADDYLPKPFELRELLARVRTILRRKDPGRRVAPATPMIGAGTLDRAACALVLPDGGRVTLTELEFAILEVLAGMPGAVVGREQLMQRATGRAWNPLDRSMDVHISNIRRKLRDGLGWDAIRTVRGVGYMLRRAPGGDPESGAVPVD